MADPIKDIEDRQGNIDMGRLAVQVFTGARLEADNIIMAFWATVAIFAGMFKAAQEPKDDEDEEKK